MKYIKYIVIILLAGIGFGFYYINQPKQSISGKTPDFIITAANLLKEFEMNEEVANKKFLDKVLMVEGKINAISSKDSGLTTVFIDAGNMMSNISCQLSREESENGINLQSGDSVKIKGICTGILMDVVLVDCVIING